MQDRVRVGVAGTGHWARTAHLPSLAAHPAAELVALADPDPGNLGRSRQRYGIDACFDDPAAMLATVSMDALVIATPHIHHYAIAAAAIARGIHVLIEKPLVIDPADGRRLIRSGRGGGRRDRRGLHVALQRTGADRATLDRGGPDRLDRVRPIVLRIEPGQPVPRRTGGRCLCLRRG